MNNRALTYLHITGMEHRTHLRAEGRRGSQEQGARVYVLEWALALWPCSLACSAPACCCGHPFPEPIGKEPSPKHPTGLQRTLGGDRKCF